MKFYSNAQNLMDSHKVFVKFLDIIESNFTPFSSSEAQLSNGTIFVAKCFLIAEFIQNSKPTK